METPLRDGIRCKQRLHTLAKSSCEENCELGGYLGNKVGYVLLNLPGTAQRFSPISLMLSKALQVDVRQER